MSPADIACRRVRISSLLEGQGVELASVGDKLRCQCPFPDHEDRSPSFYVGDFADGAEWFKCWGCGRSGNVISFLAQWHGKSNGQVLRELCDEHGISLEGHDPSRYVPRLPADATERIFREDWIRDEISTYGRRYLRIRDGCEDAVNKMSRTYQRVDELWLRRDFAGLDALLRELIAVVAREGRRRRERGER